MLSGLNKQKTLAEDEMTKAFESGIGQMQGYKQTISLANADVGNRLTRLELTQEDLQNSLPMSQRANLPMKILIWKMLS